MKELKLPYISIPACFFILAGFMLIMIFSQSLAIAFQNNQPENRAAINSVPIDAKELESFLDKFFAEKMEKLHIPGLVFVMVKDGEILFSKGYGYADLEKKKPVIPEKTLFRIGSVSKLFTATAIMQLYERGMLKLEDDVNKHLKLFQLEANYPEPVTIANLLTHTGGFDERLIGAGAQRESEIVPLGQYLAHRMPPRVLPPGDVISYSNHGLSLAGYLVEEISTVPFAQYIEENIFKPLGMEHSSFYLPDHLTSALAVGYSYNDERYQPLPYAYINIAPAGSMNSTAADMAHFMIAHLQNGLYGDNRILHEKTAQEMHQQHFTHHPWLAGWCLGFYEYFKNGQRAILHDGDLPGFAARLFLLPEHHLGFYMSHNTDSLKLRDELTKRFIDHYYPPKKQPTLLQPTANYKNRINRFIGSYRLTRYARRTMEKMLSLSLLGNITVSEEGYLIIQYPPIISVEPTRWVEIDPLLFNNIDDKGIMAFRENDDGLITHMFVDILGIPMAFEKLAWYETIPVQITLIGFIILIFLSACIAWPIGYLIRRKRKQPIEDKRSARFARVLAFLVIVLNLIFLIGFVLSFIMIGEGFVYGMPAAVIALLVVPIAAAILTIGLVIFTILAWKNQNWSLAGRIYYSLITLTCIGFILFLNYWNLIGFNY
jgi:CubicO group peptidase (beta-lactamase class C family)